MENVASMDKADEQVMSASFGTRPWFIDAAGISLAHRPRLYWLDWELLEAPGAQFSSTPKGRKFVVLQSRVAESEFITPGWKKVAEGPFPTFTTSRPQDKLGYKPPGLHQCEAHEKERWSRDGYRFPPYQYQDKHCVTNTRGDLRVPNIQEREVIMGFPKDYIMNCVAKGQQGSQAHLDTRLSLVGNSWNVSVVAWLLSQLGQLLGFHSELSLGEIVTRTSPGCQKDVQTFLARPPMGKSQGQADRSKELILVQKMLTLASVKGQDISLQRSSDDLARYDRLRASVPAYLCKWKAVASWKWTGQAEHFNSLERRAVLTALRWRLKRHKKLHIKFLHLIDSWVCLHALTRGRSSSRNLRRTMLRIGALLPATKSQGV